MGQDFFKQGEKLFRPFMEQGVNNRLRQRFHAACIQL